MGVHAATVTVTLQDADGQQTRRSFEARSAAIADAEAIALSDAIQTITQLSVVDLQVSRRVTGFASTAAEANSAVAETASLKAQMTEGDFHTFNLPALKAAYKSGKTVNGANADIQAFLSQFDDGGGVGGTAGLFYVSDGEELLETFIEAGNAEGQVNR